MRVVTIFWFVTTMDMSDDGHVSRKKNNFLNDYQSQSTKCSSKAVARRYSVKKVLLKISQNSLENAYVGISLLIKLQAPGQVFSCEFSEILKDTFFTEQPLQ